MQIVNSNKFLRIVAYVLQATGIIFLYMGFYQERALYAATGGSIVTIASFLFPLMKIKEQNKMHIDSLNKIIEDGFMFQQEQITVIRKQEKTIQELTQQLNKKKNEPC